MKPISTTKYLPTALMIALASLGLGACTLREAHVGYEERPAYYDQPVVATADPTVVAPGPVIVTAPPPAPVTVIREAPPPVYAERIPSHPRGDAVWVPGYWARDRDRWVWVGGHYETPPRRDAVWVAPRWEHHGDEFRFSAGFWR